MNYNPFTLQGKTILVTGATSGIGKITAVECSKMKANVVLVGRNKDKLAEVFSLLEPPQEGQHYMFISDFSKSETIEQLSMEVPQLDGLVNNAGIGGRIIPIQFIKEDEIYKLLKINVFSSILLSQKLYKKKKLNKNSSIVFTASIAGLSVVTHGNTLYSISKNAINTFMKGAALEMAARGIRCNTVNPGTIVTPLIERGNITAEEREKDKALYPLKRYGDPREVALGIVFLLSDAASFITGTHLTIDGGRSLI